RLLRIDPFRCDGGLRRNVGPYLHATARPFRAVLTTTVLLAVAGAAVEVWLIWYAGRVVDLLATVTAADLLDRHGGELLGAVLLVLVVRPVLQFAHEGLEAKSSVMEDSQPSGPSAGDNQSVRPSGLNATSRWYSVGGMPSIAEVPAGAQQTVL